MPPATAAASYLNTEDDMSSHVYRCSRWAGYPSFPKSSQRRENQDDCFTGRSLDSKVNYKCLKTIYQTPQAELAL